MLGDSKSGDLLGAPALGRDLLLQTRKATPSRMRTTDVTMIAMRPNVEMPEAGEGGGEGGEGGEGGGDDGGNGDGGGEGGGG